MFPTHISMTALRDVSDIHFSDSLKTFVSYISMTALIDVSDIHINDNLKRRF
jgi:hypothetical protein